MAFLQVLNPTKRKKRKTSAKRKTSSRRKTSVKRKANPRRVSRRKVSVRGAARRVKRRRNPIGKMSLKGIYSDTQRKLIPALIGGAGAVATDYLLERIPVDVKYKTGVLGKLVYALTSVGLGVVVGKVAGRDIGNQVTTGGLSILSYKMLSEGLTKAMQQPIAPTVNGIGYNDLEFYSPNAIAAYTNDTVGHYDPASIYDVSGISAYVNGH